MRRVLTDGSPGTEYWEELTAFRRSAWRFEQQPAYYVGYEREQFDKFLAGRPDPADENDDLRDWFAQVRRQTTEGKTVGRVRIIDEPPTDYQRWMLWMDRWNREAGETIQYLSRAAARREGILPAAGDTDWWLFDDSRLVLMHFDDEYRRVKAELLVDEPEVQQALLWRALAIAAANREASSKPA